MAISQADRDSIIELYIAYFNRVPEASGLAYWVNRFNAGLSLDQIADQFYSAAIQYASLTGFSALMTSAELVRAVYSNTLSRNGTNAPTMQEVKYWSDQLDAGQITRAGLVKTMMTEARAFQGDPTWGYVADLLDAKIAAGILHAVTMSVNYATPEEAFVRGKQFLINYTQPVGEWYEDSTTLYGNAESTSVLIDLTLDKLTDNAVSQVLAQGAMFRVKDVDISQLKAATTSTTNATDSQASAYIVSLIGDSEANTIWGSALGDSIRAMGGNDSITLGVGVDSVVFESSALANGIDTIKLFQLGRDTLDFSTFLNATQVTPNFITATEQMTSVRSWQNGDILVIQGYQLDTAAKLAALFGSAKPFANPTQSSKAIIISADVTGNARVWFLTNQTDITRVSANEIVQVAMLEDINNLLVQNTLASLKASTLAYTPPASLFYSSDTLLEASVNNGSITETIMISLEGDTFAGNIGDMLGEVSNVPTGLTARLIKHSATEAKLSFTGRAIANSLTDSVSDLTITFAEEDFTSGRLPTESFKDDIQIIFYDVLAYEDQNVLYIANSLSANLDINLQTNTIMAGSKSIGLIEGSFAQVIHTNLSGIVSNGRTINFLGDSASEMIIVAPATGTYRGAGGNDVYQLGTGIDTIKFEISASANGIDAISNFTIGTGGDKLDFSLFLNRPGKTKIATLDSSSTGLVTWSNGDILTVQGHGLTTASAIANLFGSVYAQPTQQAKAVVIAADLVGDATIWMITNLNESPAAVAVVDASYEVEQVGVLVGINNLLLNGFVTTNFV